MLNDAGAREKMAALGIRSVPVVAKGGQFVFGQNLEDVAEFVGLHGTGHMPLPPEQLIGKWTTVLRAGQRYVRQLPADRINERVIPNRDRSIRLLAHHMFRIGKAFLETAADGVEYTAQLAYDPLKDGTFTSGDEIARYGETVIAGLEAWWNGLADKSCRQQVKTYFGMQSIHMLYERSTWHSAQHARQLMAVLERFGIEPDGRLSSADLAGLPLPERLWE